jgi:DNA-binding CsgD family transcriptional regulator
MINIKTKPHKTFIITKQSANVKLHTSEPAYLLQEVIERLDYGILILTTAGEIVHANASAYRFCCQLNQGNFNCNFVPSVILNLCDSLLKNTNLKSTEIISLSEEVVINELNIFQIRVRLLSSDNLQLPCILVTIENQYESLKDSVLTEAKRFKLTQREAEVWILYRSNYSYKDIANNLFITLNTVKKHMKNIHAKRQAVLG